MKRLLVSLVIAIPTSAIVTVALFFVSGFLGGASHSMTPVSLCFPFATFITMRTSWEVTGFYAGVLQFPFYATVIAIVNGWRRRLLAATIVFIVHSIAAIGAVTMYWWW